MPDHRVAGGTNADCGEEGVRRGTVCVAVKSTAPSGSQRHCGGPKVVIMREIRDVLWPIIWCCHDACFALRASLSLSTTVKGLGQSCGVVNVTRESSAVHCSFFWDVPVGCS